MIDLEPRTALEWGILGVAVIGLVAALWVSGRSEQRRQWADDDADLFV